MYATQVPVVQQYNNFSQKLLSYLPDIDPNQKVRFIALPKGNDMLETVTTGGIVENRQVITNAQNIPRYEDIIDPSNNQYIRIAYFGGVITPTSKPRVVWFKKEELGVIEVIPAKQPDLYHRLMFSEFNASNPNPAHRKPESGYLFDVQKPEKSDKQKRDDRLRRMKAVEFIEMAAEPQLLRLAPKAGVAVPAYKDPDATALRNNFVESLDDKLSLILNLFTADEEKLFTLVDSAVQHEIIGFDREKMQWKLSKSQEYLCTALPGVKAEDAMVQFLILPENEPINKALVKEVAKAEANRK